MPLRLLLQTKAGLTVLLSKNPDFMQKTATVLLVDNGSLRPDATLSLRKLADGLSFRIGCRVEPVSLLHSNRVDPELLGGRPAEVLEPALTGRLAAGGRDFIIVPLFIGPSRALTVFIPELREQLRGHYPELQLLVASPLVDGEGASIGALAEILQRGVQQVVARDRLVRPRVVVCDHGSPVRAVAKVRDRVTDALSNLLGDSVAGVRAASMERRPEPEFAFNDPLLEQALHECGDGPVVVSMLFLQPGRHAGNAGDVAAICRVAMEANPGMRVVRTSLVGEDPALLPLLEERWREAAGRFRGGP